MSKKIAIITARGGSKRIPRKNIRDFCGKAIIKYSINAALDSGIFDEVMVSTDDEKIANIARRNGASVPFMRSEAASDDYATTSEVLQEVLMNYKKAGQEFLYGCCIYPTAPFVNAEKIRRAIDLLVQAEADTVIPVVAYSYPPQRSLCIKEGRLEFLHPEFLTARSQDLEKIYHDCGQFYAFRVSSFLRTGILMGNNMVPMIVDELEVQDIDNETDWKLAEIKYKLMNGMGEYSENQR